MSHGPKSRSVTLIALHPESGCCCKSAVSLDFFDSNEKMCCLSEVGGKARVLLFFIKKTFIQLGRQSDSNHASALRSLTRSLAKPDIFLDRAKITAKRDSICFSFHKQPNNRFNRSNNKVVTLLEVGLLDEKFFKQFVQAFDLKKSPCLSA